MFSFTVTRALKHTKHPIFIKELFWKIQKKKGWDHSMGLAVKAIELEIRDHIYVQRLYFATLKPSRGQAMFQC